MNKDSDKVIADYKAIAQLVRILFTTLTKGKFENQNLDITKNQELLSSSFSIFTQVIMEDDQLLLNDIIKVIGLFAKFFCYYIC